MRIWIYQTLKASDLWDELGQRLFQTSRLIKVPDEKPYLIFRVGAASGLLHTDAPAVVTPFQLFMHDVPGDFLKIDDMLDVAKTALTLYPPLVADPKLIRCEWVGNSEDIQEDPLTGTISKMASYRLVHLP